MAYKRNDSSNLPKANDDIEASEVRLVDEKGEMLGVMPKADAVRKARSRGFDLVEVSPNAEPPVCKMLDYGRYKFQQQRKKNESKKKQKIVHLKEIKVRPTIDKHDYDVKLRSIKKFIMAGDKVKVSLRFRGREIVHKDVGLDLMRRIQEDVADIAKIEAEPKIEGKQVAMIIVPK